MAGIAGCFGPLADPLKFSRPQCAVWGGAALWAGVVSWLKLSQHAAFQTQAFDLGIFANLLWNTLHGRWFHIGFRAVNHLGDHFSPLLALLSPVFLIWRDPAALLLVQTFALAAALPALYLCVWREAGRAEAGALAFLWMAFLPILHRVSRYDFHETALIPALVLWAFWAHERGRLRLFGGLLSALLLLREDGGILAAGWGAAWLLFPGARRRAGAWMVPVGLCWSALVLFGVMPLFRTPGAAVSPWSHSYGALGGSPGEALKNLLSSGLLRGMLSDPLRWRTVGEVLLWTGGLPLLAPRWAPAWAIPLALQLLGGREFQVRLQGHYSAALIPFLALSAAAGFKTLLSFGRPLPPRWRWAAWGSVLGLVVWAGYSRSPRYFFPGGDGRRAALEAIRRIPPEDAVQAQSNLFPHLCLREEIYLFPDPRRTRWVVLDRAPVGFYAPPDVLAAGARFSQAYPQARVFEGGGISIYRFEGGAD